MWRSSQIKGITVLVLLALAFGIWYAVWQEDRGGFLTVSFLDVGQGDAVFIDAPSGRQVLIDGGANSSVLRELSAVMPWWDRSIDIMIPTHPDADHIAGLIDVLPRYRVGMIVRSSVEGTTALSNTFQKEIEKEGAQMITAKRGQIIDLGKGARLEILFPDREVPRVETNVGCVVSRLIYGTTSFLLPCDTTAAIEKYLVSLDAESLHANVLKAAHHGSKTSSSLLFVGFVNPQWGIYSRGCNNSYGHPHPDTVATFAKLEIPTLDTCEEGTITFVSDGQTLWRK